MKLSRRSTLTLACAIALGVGVPALVLGVVRTPDGGPQPVKRAPVAEAAKRPNIVVIYTDDQEPATFNRRFMPQTTRLLGDEGTVFDQFIVTTPLCCPSRASFWTGGYAHNSGVFVNRDGYQHVRDRDNTLGAWMQHAGYRTAWIGKFLQGFANVDDRNTPAPGFDRWAVTVKPKYYEWKLFTEDAGKVKGASAPQEYFTDEVNRRSVEVVEAEALNPRPLFMVVNQLAPHSGKGGSGRCTSTAVPAESDRGRAKGIPLPRPPSFNRSDPKRTVFPATKQLDAAKVAKQQRHYRCRVESLAAVDRGVAGLVRAFARSGELDNTVFVFMSDNGMLLGEHALTGKGVAYEEGLRVPFAIRVPDRLLDGEAVPKVGRLATNVDLTATILDLAGADPCRAKGNCRRLDGRSLVPLLEGRDGDWPANRAIPIEGGANRGPCGYRGLRLEHEVLLESLAKAGSGGCVAAGAPEYYDLDRDPFQLDDLAGRPGAADRISALGARLARLVGCSGISGRERPLSGVDFCE